MATNRSAKRHTAVNKPPTFVEEKKLQSERYPVIAGIDEAGRGPLAGPVVAAAVILPHYRRSSWLRSVRDSKQLRPEEREILYEYITADAVSYGIGVVEHSVIDDIGIVPATKMAMCKAVGQLVERPDSLLIDAVSLRDHLSIYQKSVIKGDELCLSIAAAFVVAKVTRDRIMMGMDHMFPGYGFHRNKGYYTDEHVEGLRKLGPCFIHRRTFFPVSEFFSFK
jgi:ribonuclease HII